MLCPGKPLGRSGPLVAHNARDERQKPWPGATRVRGEARALSWHMPCIRARHRRTLPVSRWNGTGRADRLPQTNLAACCEGAFLQVQIERNGVHRKVAARWPQVLG